MTPLKNVLLVLLTAGLCACATPMPHGSGILASKVQGPLFVSDQPLPANMKVGRAESYTFLALFAHGDAGLDAAIRQGDVTVVHHADYEYKCFLFGLFAVYTTIVYGS